MEKSEQKSKKNIMTGIIIFILLIVIGGMAFMIWTLLNKPEESVAKESRNVSGGLVLDKTVDDLNEEVMDSMFTTDMNMAWTFDNGSVASKDAYIGNDSNNKRNVYFDIYLSDDPNEEILYSSPVMAPGEHLQELKLDKVLPKGDYAAVCEFHLLDENGEDFSTAAFHVSITVLS